jgi:ketol-acid reductoisomerase
MRYSISDVAEYGDLTRGPRIIDASVKQRMREVLAEIRSGAFARELIAEEDAGRPHFTELREQARKHPVEKVGAELRALAGREGLLGAEDHGGR